MDLFSFNTIILILCYVPGYIFIHTVDYFLLKREKTQFEITIQGLLASVCLLIFFVIWPYQPFNAKKEFILQFLLNFISSKDKEVLFTNISQNIKYIGIIYFLLCLYSFVFSVLYSLIRRTKLISFIIQCVTKRDYFQSVFLRFFHESINKMAIVTLDDNVKYWGYIVGSPDNEQSNHIILYNPLVFDKKKFIQLQAEKILIDTNKIKLIEVLPKEEENEKQR